MYGNSIGGLNVYARSPGGSDTLISSFTGAQQSGGAAWLKKTTSLSTFLGDTVVITLQAIKASGSSFFTYSSAICIDDIAFEGTLNCPAPTLLTASSITTNAATLTWQGTSSISIIEYGPTGFTLGTGQLINPATSPYTLTGLIPNTSYSVFIKDSCGVNLLSSNATLNFNTPNCPAVTAQGSVTLTGSTVNALNTGSPSDSILWLWGNGANSTGSSPIYTYPTPGIYTVQQVASNYCGNSDTLTFTLTVCGSVVSQFAVAGNGQTKVFNAGASIGAGLSYSWNFGDGFTATGSNPTHSFANPGVYIVNLVVTDACGIAASSSQNVSICTTVQPSFTSSAASALSFNFSAQPAGLSSYSWDFGDGTTASGAMTSHTYGSSGTFAVTLTCTDTCGGSYSVLDTVSTCPALNANFNFNIASSGSNGMLVQFFANVSGSLGLIWDWGDGSQTSTQASSISHQYATVNLNYTITLKAYNECGDTVEVIKSLNEVGLSEQSTLKYKTYPNPVSGSLTIEFTRPLNGTYYMYDVTGRLVRSERFAESAFVIFSTSDLSSGSYILKVKSDQSVTSSIVFKQ
jgi:PKD repeat protein